MKRIGLPLVVALIPALAILIVAGVYSVGQIRAFVHELEQTQGQAVFPGEMTFTCETTDEQIIWLYTSIFFEGRQYRTHDLPAGVSVEVDSLAGGEQLPVSMPPMSMTKSVNGTEARAVGLFTPSTPGSYRLRVTGESGPFVLGVTPNNFGMTIWTLGRGILAIFGGVGGALIAFAVIFTPLLLRNRKRTSPPPLEL